MASILLLSLPRAVSSWKARARIADVAFSWYSLCGYKERPSSSAIVVVDIVQNVLSRLGQILAISVYTD